MTHQNSQVSNYDQNKIEIIQRLLCERIEELFEKLDISLKKIGKLYAGTCEIHGGDNVSAINLYPDGYSVPGYWICQTHHCERFFKKTIIGFVRGILSNKKYGWAKTGDKSFSFNETINWCCDFLGQKIEDIKIDLLEVEKRGFSSNISVITKKPFLAFGNILRKDVRNKLEIPADYFVKRGWSKEILDKYDVGFCKDKSKPFFNRVVVPIYDNDYRFISGFTARSIFEKCKTCGLHHDSKNKCPSTIEDKANSCKWKNSSGFNRDSHLYNFWFAKKQVQNTKMIILCEGPGDVWKLEEAGFHNGVGLFGTSLTDQQQIMIEMSGAMKVVILTNSDLAGEEGAINIKKQLERGFKIVRPFFPANDLGDMTIKQIKEVLNNV